MGDTVESLSSNGVIVDMGREIAERVVDHAHGRRPTSARQRADVDLDLDDVGDHVRLGATVNDRRRERGVRARVRLPGEPDRKLVAEVVRASSASSSVRVPVGSEVDAFDECRHVSWISVGGRYSASRRTTSAAVTSALSVRNGCDA